MRNGFDSILKNAAEIVVVHDGARPLVASEEISKTIKSAEESGAACLVAEVTDTIKEVADGKIKRTVDRNSLRRALTPQCFRYEILAEAFSQEVSGETATDECYLVEKFGHEVAIVEGNARNIKITRKEDLVLVKNLLEEEMATS